MISSIYNELKNKYRHKITEWQKTGQIWWPGTKWEVCIGAILTQNTNWKNVEKALENLRKENISSAEDIKAAEQEKLEQLIRPSGFYRQKVQRLKEFSNFVLTFSSFNKFLKDVSREQLLAINGIGKETADSMLLYAANRPYFVIDSYTKRLLKEREITEETDYEKLRAMFESALPKDINLYKTFHALIVEYSKDKTKNH